MFQDETDERISGNDDHSDHIKYANEITKCTSCGRPEKTARDNEREREGEKRTSKGRGEHLLESSTSPTENPFRTSSIPPPPSPILILMHLPVVSGNAHSPSSPLSE